MKRVGVLTRLTRAFALQIAIISVATIGGVVVTARIVEDVLTREALNGEAEHYWALRAADPATPLPHTDNMRGYLAAGGRVETVPAELRDVGPGYQRVPFEGHEPIVHVSDHGDDRLYLVFAEAEVSNLAFYFGVAPLSAVLLLIYGLAWFTYRLSQRAVSPMVRLADRLEGSDFSLEKGIHFELDDLRAAADAEVAVMIDALDRFTARLNAFVERERNFTRDASHELRTPIAVLNGSLDLLARNTELPEGDREALARMRHAVTDMRALIDTLLLLAREDEVAVPRVPVAVNDVVAEEVLQLRELAISGNNVVAVHGDVDLAVKAPAKVVSILFGNLLRNALMYTRSGRVDVVLEPHALSVTDTGVGMSDEEIAKAFEPFYRSASAEALTRSIPDGGHGLGLAIVRRLATQFGWQVRVTSSPGKGTTVVVAFA